MNRQYSYNNFDYKYMHKGQLLLLLYIFVCGWVIDILHRPPKPVNPKELTGSLEFIYNQNNVHMISRVIRVNLQ